MKYRIKSCFIVIMFFIQVACGDWIELLPPQGLIREEFWHAKEDVEAVLMSAYDVFRNMDDHLFRLGEMRADMVVDGGNLSADARRIMSGDLHPDNRITDWRQFYQVINFCNEVIKNAPKVRAIDNTYTDHKLQMDLSEAYFLRSLSYFYLVRVYRDVPLILEPSETDESEFYVVKSDGNEILAHISADLERYRPFSTPGGFPTVAQNKGRATRAAYDALLADIALWQFDYEKVLIHVQNITNRGNHLLLQSSRWFELFYPGNSAESIFEFQFDDALSQPNSLYGITNRTSNQYDPSAKALELFARPQSREFYRGEGVSIKRYGDTEFIIWKYVGMLPDGITTRPSSIQRSANFIIYRYADLLLMKAEALSQLGRFQESLEIINLIRDRAAMPPIVLPNSEVAFEDAILDERARELAFEGKRWFDLLRMGRRNDYARKNALINILVSNAPSTQRRTLAMKLNNPLGWYFPIYESEIERNKNLEQNPYYNY
jgi:starch-binding outer membrane protein, SusD/RagB family